MTTNLNEWLAEGENLYNNAMGEYEGLVRQLEELEQRLAAKRDEVNQIAKVINKPEVETAGPPTSEPSGSRRDGEAVSGELVGGEQGGSRANSSNTIARALTGRSFNK